MKLLKLSIVDFRGLTFNHDFKDDQFIVLTGVNGSGKSTIIDVLDILLAQPTSSVNQQIALQATGTRAIFEVEVETDPVEVKYLAQKIYESQPNQAEVDLIENELKQKIFIGNKYKRRIEIEKPILAWETGRYVKEFINDVAMDGSIDNLISQNAFSVMSRELLLKFEQLDSLNLSFNNTRSSRYSLQSIFQPSNTNPGQRIARTTVSASPLFDSLITYEGSNDDKLKELILEYNKILNPVSISVDSQSNGLSYMVLDRGNGHKYTVDTASSGQKKAIVLATLKYVWNQSRFKPIILLDEPENSMHPGLTSRIFTSLNELTEKPGGEPSFIIATHSPEVVAANSKNTYRIVTKNGQSRLTKIVGLDERASAIAELGVHFHLDYVAQKIVFVESQNNGNNGGLSDADAYQMLIDPNKENYFFLSSGDKVQARNKRAFQQALLEKLKVSSSDITLELTDRDNDTYDVNKNTPYWDVEYLYVANLQLLSESISLLMGQEVSADDIKQYIPDDKPLVDIRTKDVWLGINKSLRIKKAIQPDIQRHILQNLHSKPELRTDPIKTLLERFNS